MNGQTTRKVAVILPAAGRGQRFGADANKIFQPLAGQAVFLHTLGLFASRPEVCQILLVLSADDRPRVEAEFADALAAADVQVCPGGTSRPTSVANALARVDDQADLVCVHDAVRPCTAVEAIDRVFAAAASSAAAILACPLHGTIKRVAGGLIEATVPREGLWEAQTPQVFDRGLLQRAYATGDLAAATDDAQLIEALGRPVAVVPAGPQNVKITKPEDLAFAEAVLKARPPAQK